MTWSERIKALRNAVLDSNPAVVDLLDAMLQHHGLEDPPFEKILSELFLSRPAEEQALVIGYKANLDRWDDGNDLVLRVMLSDKESKDFSYKQGEAIQRRIAEALPPSWRLKCNWATETDWQQLFVPRNTQFQISIGKP